MAFEKSRPRANHTQELPGPGLTSVAVRVAVLRVVRVTVAVLGGELGPQRGVLGLQPRPTERAAGPPLRSPCAAWPDRGDSHRSPPGRSSRPNRGSRSARDGRPGGGALPGGARDLQQRRAPRRRAGSRREQPLARRGNHSLSAGTVRQCYERRRPPPPIPPRSPRGPRRARAVFPSRPRRDRPGNQTHLSNPVTS